MKIEIIFEEQLYKWSLWDGPDGIDYFRGTELDLGQCFEQIVKYRTLNALTYMDDPQKSISNVLGEVSDGNV